MDSSEKSISIGTLFRSVQIEINTNCNRRCDICPNSIFDRGLIQNKKLMPTELFFKIIDELAEIDFSGMISPHWFGEPMLDKRLVDLMEYVRKRLPRANIAIFTNGDYLTFEKYMELVRAGVNEFHVTQHSQMIPAGIQDLYSHFEPPDLLPVPLNYYVFNEMTPLDNDGGLIDVSITNPVPCCLRYYPTIVINYEGNVVQCSTDYLASNIFGNVMDTKLLDIWFGERYREHRADILKTEFRLPRCKRCVENIDPAEMKKAYIRTRIEIIETPNAETFLYDPIELEKLRETPDTMEYYVELIKTDRNQQKSGQLIIIGGWAVDTSAGAPAAAVFITFDSGQEFRAYYPVTRSDVAAHFMNEGLQDSGFIAIIPMGELPLGKRTFRLKIVSFDRAGYYCPSEEFAVDNAPEESEQLTFNRKRR